MLLNERISGLIFFSEQQILQRCWLYLIEGFKEAAEKFRVESGIQPNMELDGLDDRIKIRDAVQNGRVEDAISLVNSLHPELLDQDRYLYFHLQVLNTTCSICQ